MPLVPTPMFHVTPESSPRQCMQQLVFIYMIVIACFLSGLLACMHNVWYFVLTIMPVANADMNNITGLSSVLIVSHECRQLVVATSIHECSLVSRSYR